MEFAGGIETVIMNGWFATKPHLARCFDDGVSSVRPIWSACLGDQGAVAMILALAIIPMILTLGIAVDGGTAYNSQSRLQGALDSAALAGARNLGADVDEMKAEARMFFKSNYPDDYLGGRVVGFDADFNADTRELTIDATVEIPTTFMRIAGIQTIDIRADARAKQLLTGIELALVLDITDSMNRDDPSGGTKLEALKDASRILLDVLYGENETADKVAVSVVPYNSLVNVGSDRTDWLDDFDEDDFDPHEWKGCVEARGGTID